MATVLTIPDLAWTVISFLPSRTDVFALSQCSRRLRDITIPSLYHAIAISVFRVESLSRTLKENRSLSQYCRRLSITLEGQPYKDKKAYKYTSALVGDVVDVRRKRILSDLEFVIHQCSEHGNLKHFSWNLKTTNNLYHFWLLSVLRGWKGVALSRASLQTLRLTVQGGKSEDSLLPHGNNLESLSKFNFTAVSKLMLRIMIVPTQFEALKRLVSSFPDVKVLFLDTSCQGRKGNFASDDVDDILPSKSFQQLQSFRLESNTNSLSACLDNFVSKQPSLRELSFNYSLGEPAERLNGTPFRIKALNTTFSAFTAHTPRGEKFSSLSTLRIASPVILSENLATFVNELTQLKCIEISLSFITDSLFNFEEIYQKNLRHFRREIIELGVLVNVRRAYGSTISVQDVCDASVHRLNLKKILSSWSIVHTIRAVRVAYIYKDYVGSTEGIPDVLDKYVLDAARIPRALEYVLWEVPWRRKLYKVDRGPDGTAKTVYTGWDSLPGRPFSPTLTWTNESVFDHMDIGEIRKEATGQ